jgi:fructosamine-3-kinase
VSERALAARVRALLGVDIAASHPLAGGCIADVRRLELVDGRVVAAKWAPRGGLAVEAWMLEYLSANSDLPLPGVVGSADDLLVLEWVANDGRGSERAEEHAAHLLAGLHQRRWSSFGLERDTMIGALVQPNAASDSWLEFFAERRLRWFARQACRAGRLSEAALGRVERVADRLDRWLVEPEHASLIHGDLWGGNVLIHDGAVAAFVDPAVYRADAEIELAFTTLFGTFSRRFFDAYAEHRPMAPDFFEVRRDLYNLYPLLVHTILFGGHYADSVDRIAHRLVG